MKEKKSNSGGLTLCVCFFLVFSHLFFMEKHENEKICLEPQVGTLGTKNCFDAISSQKDFNLVRSTQQNSQDIRVLDYAEFKNSVGKTKIVPIQELRALDSKSCSILKLEGGAFHIKALESKPCFGVEFGDTASSPDFPFLSLDLVMEKFEGDFQVSLYKEENNWVQNVEASAWNSFSHEFSIKPQKGDLVFIENIYQFTLGEDQPKGLALSPSRSIQHGVGAWPGPVGRKFSVLRKNSGQHGSAKIAEEGALLQVKRYEGDSESVFRINLKTGVDRNLRWGLIFEKFPLLEVRFKRIELSILPKVVVDKRFVFVNQELFSKLILSPQSQTYLSLLNSLNDKSS